MKKYTIEYKDIVLNTLLDAIKREKRYTIDTVDVMKYEKIIIGFINTYEIPMKIKENNRKEFVNYIEPFVFVTQLNGIETYTLLPWVSKSELEQSIEDTIFNKDEMEMVLAYTTQELRFSRKSIEIDNLKNVSSEVNRMFLASTISNISELEKQKNDEMVRLQKIKKRMNKR